MNSNKKYLRFLWRASRNALCFFPFGQGWLYPPGKLAMRFGRADAAYAWRVYLSHTAHLSKVNFSSAHRVLEIGPGQNLGTSLLWWCRLRSNLSEAETVEIICWDVFKNASPEKDGFWPSLAKELIDQTPDETSISGMDVLLNSVAAGIEKPAISYWVGPLADFAAKGGGRYDFIYSQAAIEHVWFINEFWEVMSVLTAPGGWHSHRIDLADHGRRESNYIEMLEWSKMAYWCTQRFTPGAVNRWRANDHIKKMEALGLEILFENKELREKLPVKKNQLAMSWPDYQECELLCTGLDVVAMKKWK
jgi:hypothetical protein